MSVYKRLPDGTTVKRRNRLSEQFASHPIAMLASPAWRVLSLSARRVLDRIAIELARHGGNDNGKLPVTFEQFVEFGIHRHAIAPAIREAAALGFLEVTEAGRAGNREMRRPNLFRATFLTSRGPDPTHEWKAINTVEEAMALATAARLTKQSRRQNQKTNAGLRRVSMPESLTDNGKTPVPDSGTTAMAESGTTSRISGGAALGPAATAARPPPANLRRSPSRPLASGKPRHCDRVAAYAAGLARMRLIPVSS